MSTKTFEAFAKSMPIPGRLVPDHFEGIVNNASKMMEGMKMITGDQGKAFACSTLYKGACMATEPGKLDIGKLYAAEAKFEAKPDAMMRPEAGADTRVAASGPTPSGNVKLHEAVAPSAAMPKPKGFA